MSNSTRFINGVPTAVTTFLIHYDESILVTTEIGVSGTGYNAAHTEFTLPNGETYDGTTSELLVEINGLGQVEGITFNYGISESESKITFITAIPKNARIRFIKIV